MTLNAIFVRIYAFTVIVKFFNRSFYQFIIVNIGYVILIRQIVHLRIYMCGIVILCVMVICFSVWRKCFGLANTTWFLALIFL